MMSSTIALGADVSGGVVFNLFFCDVPFRLGLSFEGCILRGTCALHVSTDQSGAAEFHPSSIASDFSCAHGSSFYVIVA